MSADPWIVIVTIDAVLETTGLGHLTIDHSPPTVTKGIPGLRIDLSSVAKG